MRERRADALERQHDEPGCARDEPCSDATDHRRTVEAGGACGHGEEGCDDQRQDEGEDRPRAQGAGPEETRHALGDDQSDQARGREAIAARTRDPRRAVRAYRAEVARAPPKPGEQREREHEWRELADHAREGDLAGEHECAGSDEGQ